MHNIEKNKKIRCAAVLLFCVTAVFAQQRAVDAWMQYYAEPAGETFTAYYAELQKNLFDAQSLTELLPYTASEYLFYTLFGSKWFHEEAGIPAFDFEKIFASYPVSEKNLRVLPVVYALFSFFVQDPVIKRALQPDAIPDALFAPVFAAIPESSFSIPDETERRRVFVRAVSRAESLLDSSHQARARQSDAVAFQMSESAFLRILNDPPLVHALYADSRYEFVLDAFLRSAAAYTDARLALSLSGAAEAGSAAAGQRARKVYEPIVLTDGGTLFPPGLYTVVFTEVPAAQKSPEAEAVYRLYHALLQCAEAAEKYGIPVSRIVTADTAALLSEFQTNPDSLFCLSAERCSAVYDEIAYILQACTYYVPRIHLVLYREPADGL